MVERLRQTLKETGHIIVVKEKRASLKGSSGSGVEKGDKPVATQ
jgi:hypothetical protein